MSAPSSLGDPLEFYVVGNFRPLRIDSERYDATVKASGPPLCYFDEDGDRITVGTARELHDRIIELQSENKSVVFALTAKAGPEWYDSECADTLIVATGNVSGTTPACSVNVPESVATPAITAISRTDSAMSSISSDYTVIDAEIPTPEGSISEVASTADDEESRQRASPVCTRNNQFSDRLIAAFENMMSDAETMSDAASSMPSSYDRGNYDEELFSEIVSTRSHTATGELVDTEQSTSSLRTLRPDPAQAQDLPSQSDSSSSIPDWADTLSDNIRRAIQQLQEVANRSDNSPESASQRLFEMDPALADHVAELVRRIVEKITDNIAAADRAFPTASNFTRDTMDRTLSTFQDFAAQIGHVALIGGYHAAAASRDAAEIGLQATREAIRAARENTQVATSQLQQCLREIAAQFNESVNAQRSHDSREMSNSDLLNQINEMWNTSQLGREEALSQTDESMVTPSSVGSAGDRYFNGSLSEDSDVDTATVRDHASPPELPRKIPIQQGTAHSPQFGSTLGGVVQPRRAASYPVGHPVPPILSPPYAAHYSRTPMSPPESATGTQHQQAFPPYPQAPPPPHHSPSAAFQGVPPPPPPSPPPPSSGWHQHGPRFPLNHKGVPRGASDFGSGGEHEGRLPHHRHHHDRHGQRLSRHGSDVDLDRHGMRKHPRDFPYPEDGHHISYESSRSYPGHRHHGFSKRLESEIEAGPSTFPPWFHGRRHAPPPSDTSFESNMTGLSQPSHPSFPRPPRFGSRHADVLNYAVPSMSAFKDFDNLPDVGPAASQAAETVAPNTPPSANETTDRTQSSLTPSAPPADYMSSEGAEWGEVASELRGPATPIASITEAVKELKLEEEEMESEQARYRDEVQIETAMSPEPAPIVEPATPTGAGNPWYRFDDDERHTRHAAQDRTGHIYHRQPNRGEVEDVGPAQDPLAGLSRGGSYTDAPGMPPSPQEILQEGVKDDTYYANGQSYEPSISGYSAAPSYHTAASIRSASARFAGQDTSVLANRIQAARRRPGDGPGSRSRHPGRPQMYIEMRQLSPEAQDRADINRLGLENEASDAERECARHLVELELISPDNMAMAIYYAQQAKGDVVDAIDLLEEDLKQLETYEARNRPVTNTANPLAGEPGD
ncbi:hypothetical protein V1517DRAFT_267661 [Lipomyces orientalis]|uniref:Uncharacterized protein n=1 Tax=Lipomyces orientalis TaxID=1233043 RepID=A0ACC3TYY1_9ASCO